MAVQPPSADSVRRFEGTKLPVKVLLLRLWRYMGKNRGLLVLALLLSDSSLGLAARIRQRKRLPSAQRETR